MSDVDYLNRALFEKVQPFQLVWNSAGEVVFLSDALAEIWDIENAADTEIMIQRPFRAAMKPEFLSELTDVLVELYLKGKDDRVFKGQIVDGKNGHSVFLGSPLVVKHLELTDFGLTLSDLPLHDRLGDLIIANEANTLALARASESEKQLHENNALLRETNKVFRRFVPSEFIRALGLEEITDVELGKHVRAELCVLFADLRNFSTLSESLDPAGVLALVNRFLSFVTPGIQEEGGHVVQYQGDGILAVFPDGTAAALRGATAMQNALRQCSRTYYPDAPDTLRMGVGLHLGQVEMGIIGNADRWESTVISDAVNTAARIEALTKVLGAEILVSESSLGTNEVLPQFETRRLGSFAVKGKVEKIGLREVLSSLPAEERALKLQTREVFEAGVDALMDAKVPEAVLAFDEVIRANPRDLAAQALQRLNLQGALSA